MAYGPPGTSNDPTNVMGRRIGAWIIDFIPALVIVVIFSRHTATTYTNVPGDFCDTFRTTHNGYTCFNFGDSAYTSKSFQSGGILLQLLYYFLVAGLLQGATGATFGKHIFGLRVVDQNGQICGIGKAMLRTLVGVFELGFCFLIGFFVAVFSHPHRRLGDMAAGT
ncbi:MAG TPA: RDD family protein, partial [Ilumatobacteraceae bacterium]